MSELELQVKGENDVLLPAELAISGLTMEEIGVVFSLHAMVTGAISKEESAAITSPRIQEVLADLKERGILGVSVYQKGGQDTVVNIDLDITNVKPKEVVVEEDPEDFWDYYEYDASDNPVPVKQSHLCYDEDSPFHYKFEPFYANGVVQYTWAGDEELHHDDDPEEFVDEEEAIEWVKWKLQDELEYIEEERANGNG